MIYEKSSSRDRIRQDRRTIGAPAFLQKTLATEILLSSGTSWQSSTCVSSALHVDQQSYSRHQSRWTRESRLENLRRTLPRINPFVGEKSMSRFKD